MINPKVLFYLASDVFAMGGIERYSRYQVQALRELLPGTVLKIYSYNSPQPGGFEEPIEVEHQGGGHGWLAKIRYSLIVSFQILISQPEIIWVNHIHLLPIAYISRIFHRKAIIFLNVYGLEIWSGLKLFEIFSLSRVCNIISDSHFTANYLTQELNIPADRIRVIWDPVDTTRFKPLAVQESSIRLKFGLPDKKSKLTLMILGRISVGSRHKGYDRLIDLMKEIIEEDITLIIAGDGDDRLRLMGRIENEGLIGKVFFTGSVPEHDLVDIYQIPDIFILVSDRGISRGEGVPLTPLEAAACGKPIIVGDQDGSQEAIREGENGYVVSPDNRDQLKRVVLRLYNQESLRIKMGINARKIIEQEFSYQVFKRKHRDILGFSRNHER